MARSTVLFTEQTTEILQNLKTNAGMKRDKAIELSILFADKNKEDFIHFIGENLSNGTRKEEKKED